MWIALWIVSLDYFLIRTSALYTAASAICSNNFNEPHLGSKFTLARQDMISKRAIGPLDKRREFLAARLARLARFAQTCHEQKQRIPGAVFVHHTRKKPPSRTVGLAEGTQSLPKQLPEGSDIRFLDYSVALLDRNRFTGHNHKALTAEILLPLLRTSSLLRSAVRAVGALSASRHGSVCTDSRGRDPAYFIAFSAYSTSISALQIALTDQNIAKRDDVLWGTFFLGLFELMVDPSGEGWAKHMLSGTSKLLQLAGLENTMTVSRRTFFEVFRVLEASRAIIYGHSTILSASRWMDLQLEISALQTTTRWKGMDEILSLMIKVSTFSARFFDTIPELASPENSTLIDDLGQEGFEIQSSIYEWHNKAMLQLRSGATVDSEFHLALACCHALLVFLSNNYNYYPFWHDTPAPRLSREELRGHVESVLEQAEQILTTSDVSSVLLLFPLRVAGTHAKGRIRARILRLLDGVFARGFVVVRRIKDDLQEYWDYEDSRLFSTSFDPL